MALIRLIPCATASSFWILKVLNSPVLATWGPPQNSMLTASPSASGEEPIKYTETISGYLAPNSICAPIFSASASGISLRTTARFCLILSFIHSSTFFFSSSVSLWSQRKSIRSRSALMLLPRFFIKIFPINHRAPFFSQLFSELHWKTICGKKNEWVGAFFKFFHPLFQCFPDIFLIFSIFEFNESFDNLTALRINRLRTYPLPVLDGVTPSEIKNNAVLV